MASTTGPDLSDAVVAIEELMDDACIVYEYSDSLEVFDPVTGTTPEGLDYPIYNASSVGDGHRNLADAERIGGKCKISPQGDVQPRVVTEGGAIEAAKWYRMGIPLDAPVIPIGSLVHCVSSRRDPQLVDRWFRVREVLDSTFAVQRKLILERR